MELEKSEKLLLATGLIMCAIIIGYNAFYVPDVGPTTIVQSEKVAEEKVVNEKAVDDSINSTENTDSVSKENLIEDTPKQSSDKINKNDLTTINENHYVNSLVNINTATEEELEEKLNGAGKAIAKRIVEYREKNGGFSNIDELKNVKGIGEKVFAKIRDNITVK